MALVFFMPLSFNLDLQEKGEGPLQSNCLKLKDAIEQETGFEISLEGVFKWIAFLPSKSNMAGVQIDILVYMKMEL